MFSERTEGSSNVFLEIGRALFLTRLEISCDDEGQGESNVFQEIVGTIWLQCFPNESRGRCIVFQVNGAEF